MPYSGDRNFYAGAGRCGEQCKRSFENGIFTGRYSERFTLTDEEMAKIAELDKNQRYYHRTDEQLVQFAGWRPSFEKE